MNKIIAKVLLIDDTPINLELLEELFLDISGVETLTADSGKAWLEIYLSMKWRLFYWMFPCLGLMDLKQRN